MHARKGIFLGYVPHTDRLIQWYDVELERVKIATHCKFDEGYNNSPSSELPPGFQQIQRMNNDIPLPIDDKEISTSDLEFFVYPFSDSEVVTVPILPDDDIDNFGFDFCTDDLNGRVYVSGIKNNSSVHNALTKAKLKRLKGAFITAINGDPVCPPYR